MRIRDAGSPLAVVLPLVTAGTLLSVSPAWADLNYGIEAGVGYSDNIARVDVAETDETIGTLGVNLRWLENTRRLNADATVDLSYFEYLDNTFDSEVLGTANGLIVLGILPERFTWLFQDSFGQAQSDPFAPSTPETRENLNYFTTGPTLNFNFGSNTSLRLTGRYSATTYERSPLDAERTSVGAALARQLSSSSEVAFNVVEESIDFDDPSSTDYDRRNAFLSYELDGARTDITAEAGYTWLERDEPGSEDTGGSLLNLSVIREISASSNLHLSLGTQLTDAGEALRGSLESGAVGGADITASPDPFENRSVSLSWNFSRNRTDFSLGASWNEDRYEEQTQFDRTRLSYEAQFTRRLSPNLDLGLLATMGDEDFDTAGLDSEEVTMGANLTWRPGRTIGFRLTVDRYDRNTSNGTGEYVENRYFLTVFLRPQRSGATPAL
jgi:hypothetical protein